MCKPVNSSSDHAAPSHDCSLVKAIVTFVSENRHTRAGNPLALCGAMRQDRDAQLPLLHSYAEHGVITRGERAPLFIAAATLVIDFVDGRPVLKPDVPASSGYSVNSELATSAA